MATTRPSKGRPRRTEAVKRLKLRESTFILWNQRKEALGLRRLTNSEFAEMLLHQQVTDVDRTGRGSRGESRAGESEENHSTPGPRRSPSKYHLGKYRLQSYLDFFCRVSAYLYL